jgi:hypothetical protein
MPGIIWYSLLKRAIAAHLADNTLHVSVMTTQGDLVYRGASAPERLAKGTAGQQLRMNSSATAPEWYTVPACRVYHDANQSIINNQDTPLAFNSERFDTDTIHDTVTNNTRLTCKTDGIYDIDASVLFEGGSTTGLRVLKIRLNGTTNIANDVQVGLTGGNMLNASTKYLLQVNDYLEVFVTQTSGGALNVVSIGNYSPEFMMVKVG